MGPGDILCITASRHGGLCAVGDSHGNVRLYGFPSSVRMASHRMYKGHGPNVSSVCFSFDNTKLLSAASDGNVFLWNVKASAYQGITGQEPSVAATDIAAKSQGVGSRERE